MEKRLLIVEDDLFLIRAYTLRFEKSEYQLTIAHDGAEALEILATHDFDAILLDLIMPRKNGIELLKALRSDEKTKHIPIIVATNKSSEEDRALCADYGVAAYCLKSDVSIDTIADQVQHALQK